MGIDIRTRILTGDPDAFRELFDEHARAVYNHAFRLTGNWSVAEDVVSVTFLEAWRRRAKVDTDADGSLRPWLLGIATNVARNVRRAARRYDGLVTRLSRDEVEADFAQELTDRINDRERLLLVRRAMAMLRRPEREVLALCVWSGLDYAQAAQALGVPVSTVRSRLSRARKRLKKLISEEGPRPLDESRKPHADPGQVACDRQDSIPSMKEDIR